MRYESGTGTGIRWAIGVSLAVIVMIGVGFGFVSYERSRGGDELVRLLDKLGAEYSIDESKSPSNQIASWKKFLGTSQPPITRIKLANVDLDAETSKQLAINRSAQSVAILNLKNVTVAEDAKLFFAGWRPVNQLVIDSCTIPDSWWSELKQVRGLEYLDLKNMRAQWMYGDCQFLGHLKRIRFQGCDLTSLQLAAIQKTIRKTKIEVLAEPLTREEIADYQERIPESIETYSKQNPQALATMELIFARIEREMQNLDPPATNGFNPPATLNQIAMLEQILKMPLPADLRGYLEIHNGQPENGRALVKYQRLLPIDQILMEYVRLQNRNQRSGSSGKFDFEPDNLAIENPNLLPIAASPEEVISLNLVAGNLIRFELATTDDDSWVPIRHAPSLKVYLEAIAEQMEAGKFQIYADSENSTKAVFVDGWQR